MWAEHFAAEEEEDGRTSVYKSGETVYIHTNKASSVRQK
jgi:hypothetical protein